MISSLLTRIAGPKVLLGVSLSAVVAIGALTWLLLGALDDAATAEANNLELRQTVKEQSRDHERLRNELDRRERVINEAIEARQQARNRADSTSRKLEEALKDDQCANTPHPDAVADSLRWQPSGSGED